MKFVCLGYMEEKKWNAMSESERNAFMSECLAYDDLLRKGRTHCRRGSRTAANKRL